MHVKARRIKKGKNGIKKEGQHVHAGVNKVIDDHGIVFNLLD